MTEFFFYVLMVAVANDLIIHLVTARVLGLGQRSAIGPAFPQPIPDLAGRAGTADNECLHFAIVAELVDPLWSDHAATASMTKPQ